MDTKKWDREDGGWVGRNGVCVGVGGGGRGERGGSGGGGEGRGQLRTKVHKDYEFRQLPIRTAYMSLLIYNLYASRLHIKQH